MSVIKICYPFCGCVFLHIIVPTGEVISTDKADINNDGSVSAADYLVLIQMVINPELVSEYGITDLNGDGKTDVADVLLIKQILLK